MSKCPNCSKELLTEHSFCPNCGHDLRQHQTMNENDRTETPKEKKSVLSWLWSPSGSIWISLFVGTIVMDLINGYFKYLTKPNSNTGSLVGAMLGAGLGFLIIVLALPLVISLIAYAIKKKFPKDEFTVMVYALTVLVSWFFLSTLGK